MQKLYERFPRSLYLTLSSEVGKAAGAALNTKVGWGIGQSKLMQLIGNTGVDVGTGVIVDVVNANTEEGDNLTGWLKKTFPKTFEFISDDIATIDGDHPDSKKRASMKVSVSVLLLCLKQQEHCQRSPWSESYH